MIRQLLLRPYVLAAPFLQHHNWMIRRAAQATVLWVATVWLGLRRLHVAHDDPPDPSDALVEQLSSSTGLREFLHGPSTLKRTAGFICRVLLLRLSAASKLRERSSFDDRNFALRLAGPIDQAVLRNLLIWQNHILPSHSGSDQQVDVTLVLTGESRVEARLFDLLSIALMLERFRSFAVFWDEESAMDASATLVSARDLSRFAATQPASDLAEMPREVISQVDLRGTRAGIKLLQQGRKHANDFFKLALPGRFIVAVELRERKDGTVETGELELWLELIETLRARQPAIGIVMLNRLAPSQWQEWPAHVQFARHQGLTLQDTICLAQTADGYLGVLDIFGLAAQSADRPGVYVPLDDWELPGAEASAGQSETRQIMVGSRDRARIEAAVQIFAAALAQT